VDVGNHTTTGDGGLDENVQLLVAPDGELQVAGSNSPHLEVLGGVTGQLEHLGGQVLQDGGSVDGGCGSDSVPGGDSSLQESVDSTDGEL